MKTKTNYSSGQVILILVLLTVIGLTVGLSLVSRTITDIRISSQIEESSRAFSGAEAAMEAALKTGYYVPVSAPTYSLILPSIEASYKIDNLGGGNDFFYYDTISAGDTRVLWFLEHENDGSLKNPSDPLVTPYPVSNQVDICWESGTSSDPGLSLTLFYFDLDNSSYRISKKAYMYPFPTGPTPPGNPVTNVFLSADEVSQVNSPECAAEGYNRKITVNSDDSFWPAEIPANPSLGNIKPIYLIIQPFYYSTKVGVVASTQGLPPQGKQIISQGKTSTGIVRKIRVEQGYYSLPEIFNYTVFGNP